MVDDSSGKMEFQDQLKSDWSCYCCNQPPVELDKRSARLETSSDPYCSIWTDGEQARNKSCSTQSFAMDARIRLDSLKSGYNSPLPAMEEMLDSYKDPWDSEESQEEESALDTVELLNVEDDVQDEENWLYQSPNKQVCDGRSESALGWCRQVLDNPSPETEAACRSLINRLDQSSSRHFYRRPEVFHLTCNGSVVSPMDQTSVSMTYNTSDSKDNELNISEDSMTSSYRLQNITDVHIVARMQEASLRKDYVSTASQRGCEPPVMFPSYFNTSAKKIDDFTAGYKSEALSSSCWQPVLSSVNSSPCQSPTSLTKQGCQTSKLSRLHQQVTQFKLLKLAQNQATSPGRTRSPLRTSLRSLQAVRNSRSLETEDYQPVASQTTSPLSGSMNSEGLLHSDRTTAVKRLRSQSASPCRIPHPAKAHLSVHGRVFASPERLTTVAWARSVPCTQR